MALRVLVIDPDEAWLPTVKKFLQGELYDVVTASNGKDAQLALYNGKFFSVIINLEIQNHSFLQVIKFIRTNYPAQRVIAIANAKSTIEEGPLAADKLQKLNIEDILVKPFELSVLKDSLEGHLSIGELMSAVTKKEGVSEEVEVDLLENNFTKIKIEEFFSSQTVLFDVYVRINEAKFVKILHTGDTFSKERIEKYKNEKNIQYLYFNNSDRKKFIQYNNFLAKRLIESPSIPAMNKVNAIKNVAEKYIEEAFVSGVKPQVIEQGKAVCENIYQLVESVPSLYEVLRSYQNFDPSAYSHAFLVTLYSTAIIKQFEWQSKITIETTAMACMFHDIGKTLLPKEMLMKRPRDMTEEEIIKYQTHPELGVKIIETNRSINNSVKQIIIQHHEAFDGTGYPNKMKGAKILTLANIVCLADDFVHMMMDEKIPPTQALKKILQDKAQVKRYNSILIEKFINVFVDPSKIQRENTLPSNSRIVNKKTA